MPSTRSALPAKTLEAKHYISTEIYDLETQRIFDRCWQCVVRESEVAEPGQCLPLELGTESVILVRDQERHIQCFYNVCRHRGTRICEGPTNVKKSIVCPYHGWTYGLNGELLAAPNMNGADDFDANALGLTRLATACWNGFVFVNFSDNLPIQLAFQALEHKFDQWSMDKLVSVSRRVYDVQANWKLLFQNYNECYHCPRIHPALNALSSYKTATNDLTEGPFLGGPMQLSDRALSMTTTGNACAAPLPNLTKIQQRRVYYYSLFPSLLLSPHPDYVMSHRLQRLGPSTTRVVCEFLFHPEAASNPAFNPAPAVEFWDETNRQDWHVCELSQQGISSRAYQPGPYSKLESTVAAFDRHYLQTMQDEVNAF